jgi:hypothetical protein
MTRFLGYMMVVAYILTYAFVSLISILGIIFCISTFWAMIQEKTNFRFGRFWDRAERIRRPDAA